MDNARLGKGLGALFGNNATTTPAAATSASDATMSMAESVAPTHTLQVTLDAIEPNPRQPRQTFDAETLKSLRDSVREHGIIQPLIVVLRPGTAESGPRYQIIAGQRRWEAAKLAGLKVVPVVVKHATPQQMLEMALIENIQREDLNPIEMARAYQMLIEEYGLTQEEVARRVGKDRTTVTNNLGLLRLPEEVQQKLMVGSDGFTAGHAKALIGIDDPAHQVNLMNQAISQHMSVREIEEAAQAYKKAAIRLASDRRGVQRAGTPETGRLEEEFTQAITLKVTLRRSQKGTGTLTIAFNNEDELNQLYELLVVRPHDEEF